MKKNEMKEGNYLNYATIMKYAFFSLIFIFHQINCIFPFIFQFSLSLSAAIIAQKSMGFYKVFNCNDLTLFLYSIYFCFILDLDETTTNITVHILNYNSSFLDNFSFIISKRLYHTSF